MLRLECQMTPAADLTKGSSKQIAWATNIRAEKIQGILRYLESYLTGLDSEYRYSAELEFIEKSWMPIMAVTDAAFWIDSRNLSPEIRFIEFL